MELIQLRAEFARPEAKASLAAKSCLETGCFAAVRNINSGADPHCMKELCQARTGQYCLLVCNLVLTDADLSPCL